MIRETVLSDVLIIGGSHAGLSAALTLYRSLHTCIIFDTDSPRNKYSTPVRLTSGWEGQQPEQMKEASREELRDAGYTKFVNALVEKIKVTGDGNFEGTDSNGDKWTGRKVLLAIGSRDCFPDIQGYEALYTRKIFPCMFQFGHELRGCSSAGLLAIEGLANIFHSTSLADDANRFSKTVTIYTNSNPSLAVGISAAIKTPDISVDDRKISSLREGDDSSVVTIEFEDGSQKNETFLVHRPRTELDRTLVDQLGLKISAFGDIEVMPPFCRTSVPGVYAAGDCASMMKIIPNALSTGAYAGCGLARELPNRVSERGI